MWTNDFEGESFLELMSVPGVNGDGGHQDLKYNELWLLHPKSKINYFIFLKHDLRLKFLTIKVIKTGFGKSWNQEVMIKLQLNLLKCVEKKLNYRSCITFYCFFSILLCLLYKKRKFLD